MTKRQKAHSGAYGGFYDFGTHPDPGKVYLVLPIQLGILSTNLLKKLDVYDGPSDLRELEMEDDTLQKL